MWYVIQTKSGEEEQVRLLLQSLQESGVYERCFLPLYEEVRRSRGEYRILFKRMFPGYFFVDTDAPEEIYQTLRRIPEFTRLLGAEDEDGAKLFLPMKAEEEDFLTSLMDDGIMHASYICMKERRIDKIIGPLAKYKNHIAKLDIPHRRAIVEVEMFGGKRKIRFSLWLTGDPPLPWLVRKFDNEQEKALDEGAEIDIGIYPGDRVVDETGLYGDMVFTVRRVDALHRTIHTGFEMMGTTAGLEISADNVRKI